MDDGVRVLVVQDVGVGVGTDSAVGVASGVGADPVGVLPGAAEAASFDIVRASTLDAAEEFVRSDRIHLVVIDSARPDSRTAAAVTRISAAGPGIPIILLTESPDGPSIARVVQAGLAGVVRKSEPSGLNGLAQTGITMLERHLLARINPTVTALIETLPDAILVVDDGGQVRFVNQAAVDLFGRSREEFVGEQFGFSVSVAPADIEIVSSGQHRTAELRVADIEWMGRSAHLATIRDVTEQREIADRFRAAQKFEALGRLAGGIAHDFNNLLAVILGCSELLLAGPPPDDRHVPLLKDIRYAAEGAAALTAQLLTFTRKSPHAAVQLDLNQVTWQNLAMLQRVVGDGIEFATDLAEDLPPITADPTQLQQVLLNLTVNARDATPPGGRIELRTSVVDDPPRPHRDGLIPAAPAVPRSPGRYVALRVRDTGEGMSEAVQLRLFEPFFTTKPRGRGTGLGLATVHGIVSQAGGFLTVDSELGHGSTFTVYLPVGPEKVAVAVAAPTDVKGRGEAVLLVEDEDRVRELFHWILDDAGYHVVPAGSGEAALTIVAGRDSPFDLLVTDVVMPGMNGYELVAALRSRQPALRTLIVSGYPDGAAPDAGMSPDGFLTKPTSPAVLLREVRAILDK